MTVSITRTQYVTGNGISLSASLAYAYGGNPHVSESVPDGTTDVNCSIPYADMRFLAIFADGALSLQGKNLADASVGSAISISATKSYIWACDDGSANPFDDDIAYFEVVNATGAAVALNIEPLTDPTP